MPTGDSFFKVPYVRVFFSLVYFPSLCFYASDLFSIGIRAVEVSSDSFLPPISFSRLFPSIPLFFFTSLTSPLRFFLRPPVFNPSDDLLFRVFFWFLALLRLLRERVYPSTPYQRTLFPSLNALSKIFPWRCALASVFFFSLQRSPLLLGTVPLSLFDFRAVLPALSSFNPSSLPPTFLWDPTSFYFSFNFFLLVEAVHAPPRNPIRVCSRTLYPFTLFLFSFLLVAPIFLSPIRPTLLSSHNLSLSFVGLSPEESLSAFSGCPTLCCFSSPRS